MWEMSTRTGKSIDTKKGIVTARERTRGDIHLSKGKKEYRRSRTYDGLTNLFSFMMVQKRFARSRHCTSNFDLFPS